MAGDGRLGTCAWCGALFVVCRTCDRGQQYCSREHSLCGRRRSVAAAQSAFALLSYAFGALLVWFGKWGPHAELAVLLVFLFFFALSAVNYSMDAVQRKNYRWQNINRPLLFLLLVAGLVYPVITALQIM